MALEPIRRRSTGADASRPAEHDRRALADRFRHSSQAERVQDPQLNAAAKVLAHTNGVIDAAYGPDTAKGASSRAAALEKIAKAIERGAQFSTPKTMQPAREQTRESERMRDR